MKGGGEGREENHIFKKKRPVQQWRSASAASWRRSRMQKAQSARESTLGISLVSERNGDRKKRRKN